MVAASSYQKDGRAAPPRLIAAASTPTISGSSAARRRGAVWPNTTAMLPEPMSVDCGILERMFDEAGRVGLIARFDELMERRHPAGTAESGALVDEVCAFARLENRAVAAELDAMGRLVGYRLARGAGTGGWAVGTMGAR